MRKEYDFSKAMRNPYLKALKIPVTIHLEREIIDYFKSLSEDSNLPYQTLINAYLTDCAKNKRKPTLTWE